MHYLQKELNRTIKYAESLGLHVKIQPATRNDPDAEWTIDGTEIVVYTRKYKSITRVILDLIHELAHHMAFIYQKRTVSKHVNRIFTKEGDPKATLTKKERKTIYDEELFDSQYQEIIFNELHLKIPLYKLKIEKDLSNWIYFNYYQTGKYPILKDVAKKRNELTKKYKKE